MLYVRARVALLMQHAKRMHHVILSPVASLAPPNFSILSHKRNDFRKNVIEHKMCVLIFSTNFIWNFLIVRNIQGDTFLSLSEIQPTPLSLMVELWVHYFSRATFFSISNFPGPYPASYTMGAGSPSGVKRPRRGINHPPPFSAEVKEKSRAISLLLLWVFTACSRAKFKLLFTLYINAITNKLQFLYRNLTTMYHI